MTESDIQLPRFINIVTLSAASWLLVIGIVMAVWNILDDRSIDIAVPDEAIALVKHDPNPPMMAWRPRMPDSVGTSVITLGSGASVCRTPNGDLMDLSACSGRSR
jgi:hypothetical protein